MSSESGIPPVLSVCLVNYNDAAHIGDCLASLESALAGIEHEIIVVDNDSKDGSPDRIGKGFPGVRLIRNERNDGFGGANNRAVRESRGAFLLFLNTDVVVRPGTIRILLDEMEEYPRTGIAGPALLNPGDVYQVSFGGRVTFLSEAFKKSFLNRLHSRRLRRNKQRREVCWVSGAFLLARREAVLETGGFDERFFLYFEDIDLCYRARERGWSVVFLPEAPSFHHGGATTAAMGLRSRLEYRRSQILFYRRHSPGLSLALLKAYLRLRITGLSLRGAFKGESAGLKKEFLRLLAKDAS